MMYALSLTLYLKVWLTLS